MYMIRYLTLSGHQDGQNQILKNSKIKLKHIKKVSFYLFLSPDLDPVIFLFYLTHLYNTLTPLWRQDMNKET